VASPTVLARPPAPPLLPGLGPPSSQPATRRRCRAARRQLLVILPHAPPPARSQLCATTSRCGHGLGAGVASTGPPPWRTVATSVGWALLTTSPHRLLRGPRHRVYQRQPATAALRPPGVVARGGCGGREAAAERGVALTEVLSVASLLSSSPWSHDPERREWKKQRADKAHGQNGKEKRLWQKIKKFGNKSYVGHSSVCASFYKAILTKPTVLRAFQRNPLFVRAKFPFSRFSTSIWYVWNHGIRIS
jgi:hypothetical protein